MDEPAPFCPTCHEGAPCDPLTEYVKYCDDHYQVIRGSEDGEVHGGLAWVSYVVTEEAEAATNRAACAIVHREQRPE